MKEIWKTIPYFSLYEVSNTGLLKSKNYKRTGYAKILKPAITKDGYLQTMLLNDSGKYCSKKIHYFVTLAFYGERNIGLEVNHKNGIKTDNSIENLEFVTKNENIKHAYKNGLIIAKRGSSNGMSKLTEEQVKEIRDFRAGFKGRYYNRKELAKKYGVSERYIKDIVTKRRNIWPHVN